VEGPVQRAAWILEGWRSRQPILHELE
jgi:hypothetical protein